MMPWFMKSSSSRKDNSEGGSARSQASADDASEEQPTFSSAPKAPTRRMTKSDKALMATSHWSAVSKLKLEDPVSLADSKSCLLQGVVAYVGEVDFNDGIWVGVQLTGPSVGKGYNDGSVNGKRYFGSVGKKNGVFCHISKIQRRVKSGDPSEDRRQKIRQTPKAQLAELKYVETLKKEREAALLKQSEERRRFQLRKKGESEEKYIQRLKQQSLQELRISRNEPIEGEELLTLPGPKLKFGGANSSLCKADFDFVQGLQDAQQNFVLTDPTLPDNPVTFASQAFLNMTGYNLSEILGTNCRFLQGKNTSKQAVARIRLAIDEGSDCSICLLNYRKDGSPFWNEFFITALRDNRGRVKNYIGVQCEVSEQAAAMRNKTTEYIASRSSYSQIPGAVDELAQPDDFSAVIESYSPMPEITTTNNDSVEYLPSVSQSESSAYQQQNARQHNMTMFQPQQQNIVGYQQSIAQQQQMAQQQVAQQYMAQQQVAQQYMAQQQQQQHLSAYNQNMAPPPQMMGPDYGGQNDRLYRSPQPGVMEQMVEQGARPTPSIMPGRYGEGIMMQNDLRFRHLQVIQETEHHPSDPPSSTSVDQRGIPMYSKPRDPSPTRSFASGQHIGHVLYPSSQASVSSQSFAPPSYASQSYAANSYYYDGMSSLGGGGASIAGTSIADNDELMSRASRASASYYREPQNNSQHSSRRMERPKQPVPTSNRSLSNDTRSAPSVIQSSISSYTPSKTSRHDYSFDEMSLGGNSEQFLPGNLEAKNYVVFPGMSLTQLEVGWPGEDASGDERGNTGDKLDGGNDDDTRLTADKPKQE